MVDYNNRTMLVDGDIIAYMCSTQMEEPIKWDDDTWTLHASESKSIDKLWDTIEYYRQILICKNVVVAPQNIIVGNINIGNNISIHANQVISNDINNNDKISNYKFSKILNDQ